MRSILKTILLTTVCMLVAGSLSLAMAAAPTAKAAFDATKMSDMTGWDPANWVNPKGDTIRIAIVWPHSGPGALNGQMGWLCATFVAYDINKRGGIMVDGKKKKIALYKADSQSRPD
ncbi:MAG: branched-chain amino acid ABC transporter substrate-binding protein, partial [Smithella sp.]|nr:branched-chain amino acid ABC transporter substrate-binding protein [Smithella sp.]